MSRTILAILVIAVLAVACRPGNAAEVDVKQVEGILVDVVGEGFVRPQSIRLRDDEGREWTFQVAPDAKGAEGEPPPNAGHLRAHMAQGDRVVVHYRYILDDLIAVQITHQ